MCKPARGAQLSAELCKSPAQRRNCMSWLVSHTQIMEMGRHGNGGSVSRNAFLCNHRYPIHREKLEEDRMKDEDEG